jgi:general secretion pathway protein G
MPTRDHISEPLHARAARRRPRAVRKRPSAFTLIEILVVVVILGILAAIVIPSVADAAGDAEANAFAANIRTIAEATELFYHKEGFYPEDSSSGEVPAGLENYLDTRVWTQGTPIGGVWDYERDSFGVTAAFGVHFQPSHPPTRDSDYMETIDDIVDDGDLMTGAFQQIAGDRYYWIVRF